MPGVLDSEKLPLSFSSVVNLSPHSKRNHPVPLPVSHKHRDIQLRDDVLGVEVNPGNGLPRQNDRR